MSSKIEYRARILQARAFHLFLQVLLLSVSVNAVAVLVVERKKKIKS
jgi:hypothetical protein